MIAHDGEEGLPEDILREASEFFPDPDHSFVVANTAKEGTYFILVRSYKDHDEETEELAYTIIRAWRAGERVLVSVDFKEVEGENLLRAFFKKFGKV